jgi:hypothetical protein
MVDYGITTPFTPTRVGIAATLGTRRKICVPQVHDLYVARMRGDRRMPWLIAVDLVTPMGDRDVVWDGLETRQLVESLRLAYDFPSLGLLVRITMDLPAPWDPVQRNVIAWMNVAGRTIGGVWTDTDLRTAPWDPSAVAHTSLWRGVVETSNQWKNGDIS